MKVREGKLITVPYSMDINDAIEYRYSTEGEEFARMIVDHFDTVYAEGAESGRVMAIALHFPVHIATATSQFVLGWMALDATAVHVATGTLGWDRTLVRAGVIAAGAAAGAQLGAALARRLRGDLIIRILGAALLLVAARLLVVAAGF